MKVSFQIQRKRPNESSWVQTYAIETSTSMTILDCLNHIKHALDGSLSFRKNCRNTICGSCSMQINGRAALACQKTLQSELAWLSQLPAESSLSSLAEVDAAVETPVIAIQPMANFPVIKDLVVDMSAFWQDLDRISPFIHTVEKAGNTENLQSPAERAELDQVGNCILCGACYSACNAKTWSPEFVGPHAMAKGLRLLADSRDQDPARLSTFQSGLTGVWGCTRCFNCNAVCPMEVAPLDQISRIKARVLASPNITKTRAVRHRLNLLQLVSQGGWIDERKFGLQVIGHNGRDLKGLLSLIPLGLRMIRRGKFPGRFEPSRGTQQVARLRSAVQSQGNISINSKAMSPEANAVDSADATPEQSQSASSDQDGFGWTSYAEKINGRFAMVGFVIILLIELLSHQSFWVWLGL